MSPPPFARRTCAAAILAGGRATRLHGVDKGGLLVGGRTIRDRQLDALRGLVDDIFLVGAPAADHAAGIVGTDPAADPGTDADPPPRRPGSLPRVPDLAAGRGPLGGIQTALHRAGDAACTLIVACDLPFLSRPFLAFLLDRARDAADTDVVVPRSGDRLHPLCATYNRRVREVVDRRVASGALAVQALFDEVRVDVVEPEVVATFDPEGVMFWNVNTPDEYERACARAAMA
jgi:molybdopterin-guanine dinucleotide biosynthesis protein A